MTAGWSAGVRPSGAAGLAPAPAPLDRGRRQGTRRKPAAGSSWLRVRADLAWTWALDHRWSRAAPLLRAVGGYGCAVGSGRAAAPVPAVGAGRLGSLTPAGG